MKTKLSSLMTKYEPKSLSDYTTFDLKAKTVIFGYPHGTLTRPLLLVGPAGSGKTQLAKLLAAEIIPEMTSYDIKYVDASEDPSVKTVQRLSGMMNLYAKNPQNLHVGIIDEAHDLTSQAMTALKGLLSKYPTLDKGAFFILVTNHLSGVSDPVRDRCQVLHVPATTVDDVLPVAERVLTGEGLPYTADVLKTALAKDSSGLCSFREMWGTIEEIMTGKVMAKEGVA
jgi:DNA polymerase III delta prime subunit